MKPSMRADPRTLTIILALAMATTSAREIEAQADTDKRALITAGLLRRACVAVVSNAGPDPLEKLCELEAPSDVNLGDWTSLTAAELPDLPAIRLAAQSISDDDWEAEKKEPQRFEMGGNMGLASAAGGVASVSTILWGVSDFLVERGREQLRVTVVNRLTAQVCTPERFAPVLLETCGLLAPPGGASALPGTAVLRTAVRTDLVNLPGNTVGHAMSKRSVWRDSTMADAASLTRLASYYIGGLVYGRDPREAFARLGSIPPIIGRVPFSEAATPAALYVYSTAAFYAAAERDSNQLKAHWPPSSAPLMKLYALKAMALNAANGRPARWHQVAPATGTCLFVVCRSLLRVSSRINSVETFSDSIQKLRKKVEEAKTTEERALAMAWLLDGGRAILASAMNDLSADQPSYLRTAVALQGVGDVAHELAAKNYAAVALRTLSLADTLGLGAHLPKESARVLSFAADVAEAEDSEGVNEALDHFVGRTTYLRKRAPTTGWYLNVNGYIGGVWGEEDACRGAKTCANTAHFAGAWAPIGMELGHSVRTPYVSSVISSIGVFVQAIDLGALASWRLTAAEDSVSSEPQVGFEQVFAPGINVVFGIRNFPLTIGVGTSRAAKLREIRANGELEERNAIRNWAVFGAIDIPLYP